MIILILLLIMLITCTYLLFINTLNIIYYVLIVFLMVLFLVVKIKFFENHEKENEKERRRKFKNLFPLCKPESFPTYIFGYYKDIIKLINNKEKEELKKYISKNLYKKYKSEISYFEVEHNKNIIDEIDLISVNIVDITDNSITLYITYKCLDYTVNRKNKVIRGYKDEPVEYTYLVKFHRNNTNIMIMTKNKLISQK